MVVIIINIVQIICVALLSTMATTLCEAMDQPLHTTITIGFLLGLFCLIKGNCLFNHSVVKLQSSNFNWTTKFQAVGRLVQLQA